MARFTEAGSRNNTGIAWHNILVYDLDQLLFVLISPQNDRKLHRTNLKRTLKRMRFSEFLIIKLNLRQLSRVFALQTEEFPQL